jgi:hypothetical protein
MMAVLAVLFWRNDHDRPDAGSAEPFGAGIRAACFGLLMHRARIRALALYFLPAIVADRRKRRDVLTLALFNACVGWTGLGWLLALYWSLQPNPPENIAGEVVQTRKLVRMRAFSTALMLRVQKRASAQDHRQEN